MTCRLLQSPPDDVPYEELRNSVKYYHLREGVEAIVFRTGKVKVFASRYPLPPLPYYGDCRVENAVARTAVPAMSVEDLKALLERHGFTTSDREKVNAVLAYLQSKKATVRIFPKTGVARYKAIIFAPTPEAAEEVDRLLASILG
jgi:hypothetical protein